MLHDAGDQSYFHGIQAGTDARNDFQVPQQEYTRFSFFAAF